MSFLKVSIRDDFSDALMRKLEEAGPRAAHALAVQAAKDTEDFVPASGSPAGLSNRSQVIENKIIYPGPYARYLYEGKVMVDSVTGKGPMRIKAKDGTEIIRFRKGATLKPTTRPLDFDKPESKKFHKNATDHWFEASKAQNIDKWERVAGKAVARELTE